MTDTTPLATRDRLLAAAARLFTREGFHGTTTGAIAAAAGISQPSLYKHFPAKHDLLIALHRQVIGAAVELLAQLEATAAPAVEQLYRFLHEAVIDIERNPQPLAALLAGPERDQVRFREMRDLDDHFDDLVVQLVTRAQTDGQLIELDPLIAATLSLGTLETLARRGVTGSVDEVLRYTLGGLLRVPEHIAEIRERALSLPLSLD